VRRGGVAPAVAAGLLAVLVVAAAPAAAGVATRPVSAAVRAATPARAPFRGLTATTIHVGGRAVRVVVAKTERQREAGLRKRADLGPYGGMLFVFPADTQVDFTMSTVPVALDIGFYAAGGRVVDHLHMLPCPGPETSCPVYAARGAFRYAVETLTGGLPTGRLSG
jgi:uncharacterized membrane protein (UPF0127 family)